MAYGDGGQVDWLCDVAAAAWIEGRLNGFLRDVGSVIPAGFEAYGRLFHPIESARDNAMHRECWRDLAKRNHRIAHSEMQLHSISRPRGEATSEGTDHGPGPSWGSLPLEERSVLVEMLRAKTTTSYQCWFCVWEGFGGLDDGGVTERVELPHRRYLLRSGPIETAIDSALPSPFDQSSNLWWPEDRAWIVATEIDYAWTYVGGSRPLIDALIADDRLEVLRAYLHDQPFFNSDVINAALDSA
jgi:hypothetical protein